MALTLEAGPELSMFDYSRYAFLADGGATELILVRHAQQEAFLANAAFENNSDPPSSAVGQRQAEAVGHTFADRDVDAVYSSTLARAVHTGREIARHHSLEPDAVA